MIRRHFVLFLFGSITLLLIIFTKLNNQRFLYQREKSMEIVEQQSILTMEGEVTSIEEKSKSVLERYMNTLEILCPRTVRLGALGTDGWVICATPLSSPCTVVIITNKYRKQLFLRTSFNAAKCTIHLFDQSLSSTGTRPSTNRNTSNITEHRSYKIGHENTHIFRSIKDVLTQIMGILETKIDVLILDEIFEYFHTFDIFFDNGLNTYVKQLIIRPVVSVTNRRQHYMKHVEVFRKLYHEGFRKYHIERKVSNECELTTKARDSVSCFLLSMININLTDLHVPFHDTNLHGYQSLKHLPLKEMKQLFLQRVTSPQVLCEHIVRVGNVGDGGWDVCHDKHFRPGKKCLVYSFGINYDFSFDKGMTDRYGCDVYSFDPSMKMADKHLTAHVHYHNIGISGRDSNDTWALKRLGSIKHTLGHSNRNIDVLKMDVEGAEYDVIPEMIESRELQRVRQFAFEVHTFTHGDNSSVFWRTMALLDDLDKIGFKLFRSHFNVACQYLDQDLMQYSSECIELYFINTKH